MKRIFQIIMVAVISATFSLVFSSCEDDWDGIGSGGNGSSSGSYSNKFDYIYNCIGKNWQEVLTQLESEGYRLDNYYISNGEGSCMYRKDNKNILYIYYIAVTNNIMYEIDYSENYAGDNVDCNQLKNDYVQIVTIADERLNSNDLYGELYFSNLDSSYTYADASNYINAVKNYSIINNCRDEYMNTCAELFNTTYRVKLNLYLEDDSEGKMIAINMHRNTTSKYLDKNTLSQRNIKFIHK